jgi:flagellar protein FliO/FliZ
MEDTSGLVLGLRVLLSLGCVLGLIWYANRRLSGSAVGRARRTAPMTVVARQALGGKNGLAVVDVAGRRLLLGTGEQGVTLLTELEAPDPAEETAGRAERVALAPEELARLTDGNDLGVDVPSDLSGLDAHRRPGRDLTATAAARMPAVTEPRNPLEGSILDAATWRRAVVAVQERTIRR